jgi:hypothetical protein
MVAIVLFLALLLGAPVYGASPRGFHFYEGITHTEIPFELYKNLIVIPAQLNDSTSLKLILDTGTRSVLLYGRRFKKMGTLLSKKIRVSGWGASGSITAHMAYPNKIEIGAIRGTELNIAVVPDRKFLPDKSEIDGLIGYELFVRFAVEINYFTRTIHLYDRLSPAQLTGFSSIPIEINLSRPEIHSRIRLHDQTEVKLKLLVDTGSSLGLTIFARDVAAFRPINEPRTIGIGVAGLIQGFDLFVDHVSLGPANIKPRSSHLVAVSHHPDEHFTMAGSLGAEFLKEHVVIFDYPESRLLLKKMDSWTTRK